MDEKSEPDVNIAAEPSKLKRFDEFLNQQKLLIEKLDVITRKFEVSKKKDFWDVVSSLSGVFTFLSSLVIAGLGVYFTDQYRKQDVRIAQAQAVEKFLPYLSNKDESLKRSALLAVSALQDKEFATRLASSYASNGTIDVLEVILKNAAEGDSKELLTDTLADAYLKRARNDYQNSSAGYNFIIADYNRILALRNDDYFLKNWGEWDLANIYSERGNAYRDKGDYSNAAKDYETALRILPNNSFSIISKAIMYMYKNEDDTALTILTKQIEISPDCGECYTRRGEIYEKKGMFDKATIDFNDGISREPNNAFILNRRAYFFLRKKEFRNAEVDFKNVVELTDNEATRNQAEKELKRINPKYTKFENKIHNQENKTEPQLSNAGK